MHPAINSKNDRLERGLEIANELRTKGIVANKITSQGTSYPVELWLVEGINTLLLSWTPLQKHAATVDAVEMNSITIFVDMRYILFCEKTDLLMDRRVTLILNMFTTNQPITFEFTSCSCQESFCTCILLICEELRRIKTGDFSTLVGSPKYIDDERIQDDDASAVQEPTTLSRNDAMDIDEDIDRLSQRIDQLLMKATDSFQNSQRKNYIQKIYTILNRSIRTLKKSCFKKWCNFVRSENNIKFEEDKMRFCLHAEVHVDEDVEAWYHHMFYNELYTLARKFFLREVKLRSYKGKTRFTHRKVKSCEEKHLLKSVLLTRSTLTQDIMCTIILAQSVLFGPEKNLFEALISNAVPMKTVSEGLECVLGLRLSFANESLYLSWPSDKGTMQGIAIEDVLPTVSFESIKSNQIGGARLRITTRYCNFPAFELYVESIEACKTWCKMLTTLADLERGQMILPEFPQLEIEFCENKDNYFQQSNVIAG